MATEEMKNEVRKDFLGRQIVVTVARAGRPHDNPHPRAQKVVPPEKCFFCPGNERLTPPEIDRLEKLYPGLRTKLRFVDAPQLEISSTTIRQRIEAGGHYQYYLVPQVYDYIQRNHLYR